MTVMHTRLEQEEFIQLIKDNKGIIIKICNAYCQHKTDREDLAQEISFQLWRSGKYFDGTHKFSTWMYRVALNVAISFYRKEKKHTSLLSLSETQTEIAEPPDATDEMEENIARLQIFIHELKELDRALMILYLESKSYREIGDILGITETNVATKISRIKEKLKQKFLHTN